AVISTRQPSKFFSCVEYEPRHGETQNSLFNTLGEEMDIIMKDASCACIRDNVLFGKDYDPISDVLRACALVIDVSCMVGGDMAYIGGERFNLSGGLRARLALARAIYHGSDLVSLDDVLSAVDAQVASWII
nr:hypothetical protein [Tanacetum cinerariifolium]